MRKKQMPSPRVTRPAANHGGSSVIAAPLAPTSEEKAGADDPSPDTTGQASPAKSTKKKG